MSNTAVMPPKMQVPEVYRQPVPIAGYPLGYGYQQVLRLTDSDSISPLSVENATISVADLLP